MIRKLSIQEFIGQHRHLPVLDVRSPGEFVHAHIPGATSLPLFTDEERKVVGTLYKQESRQKAIKAGLNFFGPKMTQMVETVEALMEARKRKVNDADGQDANAIVVHCWRGGMRSAGVAWLLDLYGFKVYTIVGGYKSYRKWVREVFASDHSFKILGGYTGSGKTKVLEQLRLAGEAVVDLEGIASHKGSAFGRIGMNDQPSQEMFENLLATDLFETSLSHPDKEIWLEDESQRIGLVNLPPELWHQIRSSKVSFIDIPFEERLDYLLLDYSKGDTEEFVNAIIRIKKRLGGLEAKTAIGHLLEGDMKEAFRILLTYYDKWYTKGLYNRESPDDLIEKIPFPKVDPLMIAKGLLALGKKM